MTWLSQNLTLIFQLLPGFITAAVFYSLTAHRKASEFERVVQALIFTLILKIAVMPIGWLLTAIGRAWAPLGKWSADAELVWMTLFACPLGILIVWVTNHDIFHAFARKKGLTSRPSYPSEWYSAFHREKRWVILNMTGGRRLLGWPEEWPDHHDQGHFLIEHPYWVMDDGSRVPLLQTNKYLVRACDVEQVEFLRDWNELTMSEADMKVAQQPLLELHKKDADGSQAIATSTGPPACPTLTDGQPV